MSLYKPDMRKDIGQLVIWLLCWQAYIRPMKCIVADIF